MKDDYLDKLKQMLSGSINLNKKIDMKSNYDMKLSDNDAINSFMNQLLDTAHFEEDLKAMCAPSYHLSKKNKSYWLMNTTLKTMVNVKSGIEIIPIENGQKNTACLIGNSLYSIPNEYIICSGWN